MQREEIESKLKELIADLLGVDEVSIHNDSHFINDLNADSLDGVEIIMNVEDEFNIDVIDDEAESAVVFSLLVDLVENKLNR